MNKKIIKIYKHIYDNPLDDNGIKKPNKLLGKFVIIEGDNIDEYSFRSIGVNVKNEKIYKIIGTEISYLRDSYNSGTKCYVEEMKLDGYKIIKNE